MIRTVLGLGSNIGDSAENIRTAVNMLRRIGRVEATSDLFFSKAWGITDQADFHNAAAILEVDLSPEELLKALKKIEKTIGRKKTCHWGPRLIDIDILEYGGLQMQMPELVIPHPYMLQRAFVLKPCAQLDARFAAPLRQLPAGLQDQVIRVPGL